MTAPPAGASLPDLLENLDAALSALAERPAGLFVDFDGTISRLAPTPSEAAASVRAVESLGRLAQKLHLVCVLSGRRAQDIRDKVGIPGLLYVGNHGAERIERDARYVSPLAQEHRAAMERVMRALRSLAHVEGMIWERKGFSAAVHYRAAADPASARRRLAEALADTDSLGLQTFWGKMILEIRPPAAPHKGYAIRALVEERNLKGAVFIGDDSTDIDGMKAIADLRAGGQVHAIGAAVVDESTPSALLEMADFRLAGVTGVEEFLERAALA